MADGSQHCTFRGCVEQATWRAKHDHNEVVCDEHLAKVLSPSDWERIPSE